MLTKLFIYNFKIFSMPTELDLTRSKDTHLPDHILNHDLLKTAMIFGPNNVGKSCFVEALKILRAVALRIEPPDYGLLDNYANNLRNEPTTLGVEVILGKNRYMYAVDVKSIEIKNNNDTVQTRYDIASEFFTKFDLHSNAVTFDKWVLGYRLRDDNYNDEDRQIFKNWLKNDLVILSLGESYINCRDETDLYNLSEVVKCMDLGIKEIRIDPESDSGIRTEYGAVPPDRLTIIHNSGLETGIGKISEGTRRVIEMGSILIPGSEGKTFVIDEINRKLHPALTERLIQLFLGDGAEKQLIFTTHEIRLLDDWLFRRDEAWAVIPEGENHSKIIRFSDGLNNNPPDEKLSLREIHDETVRRNSNADE